MKFRLRVERNKNWKGNAVREEQRDVVEKNPSCFIPLVITQYSLTTNTPSERHNEEEQ